MFGGVDAQNAEQAGVKTEGGGPCLGRTWRQAVPTKVKTSKERAELSRRPRGDSRKKAGGPRRELAQGGLMAGPLKEQKIENCI